jgi:cyclophilin family peptidyl-prolyl cis-trans isomerase
MHSKQLPTITIFALLLSACGGGGGSGGGTPDTTAPTISGVSVSAPSNGQVTLTAAASDATGVTGYCFKTDATAPTSTDSCFSANTALTIATPNTPTRYYVWSKDAANNLSAVFERVAGACSATGVTASQSSVLPTVCVSTSLGEFVLALESTKAPITTTNFLKYVNDGFYSQTVFHRVISNFMVQGGGFTGVPISSANAKTGTVYAPIVLETTTQTGLSNTTGTIAMARQTGLNTATNQFFINVVDNTFLNTGSGGYAAFGNVISGLDTSVQSIRSLSVQSNGSEISQPLTPPVINWAYQLK